MSWPGFHAGSAAWLFLLIPPLVALYFLKLKRPTLLVPSRLVASGSSRTVFPPTGFTTSTWWSATGG